MSNDLLTNNQPQPPEGQPNESWSDEALLQFSQTALIRSDRHDEKRIMMGRLTIEERLDAAPALSILKRRHKDDGKWCELQDQNNLSRTTVWEVIEVYERALAKGHTKEYIIAHYEMWTEVTVAYSVTKKRKKKQPEPAAVVQEERRASEGSVEGSVEAEEVVEKKADDTPPQAPAAAPEQAEQGGGGNAATTTAKPAPKPKMVAKKDQAELGDEEIDAGNNLLKAAGSWDRAVFVIETLKNIAGG